MIEGDSFCNGKIIYTKKGAQSAKNARSKRPRKGRRKGGSAARDLRIYECPHCGGWHLTKKK